MKVAFIVNNYPPRVGGVEFHVEALARELAKLGHEPIVVTLANEVPLDGGDAFPVVRLREHLRIANILGFPSPFTAFRISRLLRTHDIDVVSIHTRFFPMSYVGYRAARRAHVPVIHTEHGSGHVESDSLVIKWASRLVDFSLGRVVLRRANVVLGVSEEVCDFVQRLAGVSAQLFYNAIHLSDDRGRKLEPRPDRLVFVGRLVPGKGWETFLTVVAELRSAGIEVAGDVVGDGPEREALLNRIRKLELEGCVTVHGRVPQDEVRHILRGATLVNPTVLSEGFQTTLLEAIAEGGYVVTYPVPGARRLEEQGAPVRISAGRTAESLRSAIADMLSDLPESANPDLVTNWSWARRAEQYVEIMASVSAEK